MRLVVFQRNLAKPLRISFLRNGLITGGILVTILVSMAAPPAFQWAKSAGGISYDYGFGVATDAAGNSFVAGEFRETANFGPLALTNAASDTSDMYLVKYDPTGNPVWARRSGGISTDSAKAVGVDTSGNVYVVGDFSGTASFGTNVFTSSGSEDMFLLKYDATGNLLWARKGGGTGHDFGLCLAAGSNFCYVAGTFENVANFSGTNLASAGGYDIFIAKYDGLGALQWIRSAGGAGHDQALGVAADNLGRCRVTGYFTSTNAMFGSVSLTNASLFFSDAFVSNYDPAGNLLWATRLGGTDSERGVAVATDVAGNSFVTGSFASTNLPSGAGSLTNRGGSDVFLAKLDLSGSVQWISSAGGVGEDNVAAIALDSSGNPHVIGNHLNDATFGNTTLTNTGLPGSLNGFVAKSDGSGNFVWAKDIGGSDDESPLGIGLDASDNIYLAGSFTSAGAKFDSLTVTNAGTSDIFVARIAQEQPQLGAVRTANSLVISWPAYLQGFNLESSSNTVASSSWSQVLTTPVLVGGQRYVTNPITPGQKFFRTRKP